jgi:hypothetical protein
MDMRMLKTLMTAAAVFALASCGQQPASKQGAAPAQQNGAVTLGSTQDLPDWLLIARQRDCDPQSPDPCQLGDIQFNQRTITRNADGTADIWVQVRHGQPQLYEMDSPTQHARVRYQVERLQYRFNCSTQQFVVLERQIMGANDTVVAHDEPRQIYRAPVEGSVTTIIAPIACHGS